MRSHLVIWVLVGMQLAILVLQVVILMATRRNGRLITTLVSRQQLEEGIKAHRKVITQ